MSDASPAQTPSAAPHDPPGSSERSRGFFLKIGAFIADKPTLVLGVVALVSLAALFGVAQLKVNNANDIFFVEDDPLLVAHKKFQEVFGSDEFVLLFVEGDPFAEPTYKKLVSAVQKMEALRFDDDKLFTTVLSPYNAPVMKEAIGELKIGALVDDMANATPEQLAEAKKTLTTHPIYAGLLIRKDAKAAAVVGTLHARQDVPYMSAIADEMEKVVKDSGLEDEGAILVGNPIFKKQIDSATITEAAMFGSLALLVALVALFIMFRRKRQVIACLLVVTLSVLWTLAILAATGTEMNLVSIILPLIIVIMGLGDGVHVINGFRHQRSLGKTRRESVIETLPEVGIPCLMTSVTTAIGFLAMLTAPVAPLRTLGLFIAIGIMVCMVLSLTVVPALLAYGDNAPASEATTKGDQKEAALDEKLNAAFGKLAEVVVGNRKLVTLGFLAFAVLTSIGIKDLYVESHPLHQFREDFPFRQAVQKVDDTLGGTTSVEVVIDTGVERGIYDPEFIRRVDELQTWVKNTQGDIAAATLSMVDLLREIQFAVSRTRTLPETRQQVGQLLLLYESGEGDLRLISDTLGRRARMSIRLRLATNNRNLKLEQDLLAKADEIFKDWKRPEPTQVTSQEVAKDDDDDDDALIIDDDDDDTLVIDDGDEAGNKAKPEAAAPVAVKVTTKAPPVDFEGAKVTLAGTSQLFVHLAEYVVQSQVQSFLLAVFIISLLMAFILKSPWLGLLVMFPNILPIFVTYGFMGWTGRWVDYLTATIAVGALGVAVDGTIHIGTRYRRLRERGHNAEDAARDVMVSIGRALVVTSIVLVAGFLVLLPSMLSSLGNFGMLMALCLAMALVFDLVMTPAVLAWLSPNVKESEQHRLEQMFPESADVDDNAAEDTET